MTALYAVYAETIQYYYAYLDFVPFRSGFCKQNLLIQDISALETKWNHK